MQDTAVGESLRNKRLYKITLGALKIIPMLLALCAILNVLLSYLNIRCELLSILGGSSLFTLIFLYLASYAFRFCIYHRMFLHYIVVNNLINLYDRYFGIPVSSYSFFVFHVLVVGVFLFLVLYFYRRERCCK